MKLPPQTLRACCPVVVRCEALPRVSGLLYGTLYARPEVWIEKSNPYENHLTKDDLRPPLTLHEEQKGGKVVSHSSRSKSRSALSDASAAS